MGSFKKETLKHLKSEDLFGQINNFDSIPLKNLVNLYKDQVDNYQELTRSLEMLDFLSEYRNKTKSNIDVLTCCSKTIESVNQVVNFNLLLNKKKTQLKGLEISKIKRKSSKVAAKADLLNKLRDSTEKNKMYLRDFDEDYSMEKNRMDQIKNVMETYKSQIKDFNRNKKECFNQINNLTREMDDLHEVGENHGKKKNEKSYSEQMQALRKQAQEYQYEINQANKKLIKSKAKFDENYPKFKLLDENYKKLLEIVKKDEIRANNVQIELEWDLRENSKEIAPEIDIDSLDTTKSTEEIEELIESIDLELNRIDESNKHLDSNEPENLSIIIRELIKIKEFIKNNKKKYELQQNDKVVFGSIENFRRFDIIIKNIEKNLSLFLGQINIESRFDMFLSEDLKHFHLKLQFFRAKNKEHVSFNNLTTPEKIYFVIALFISFKISIKSQNIIFSNLFIPKQYNKRGSVYRTIKKIIPLFKSEIELKKYNLVFILSNLELKDKIEDLKTIEIKEDEK